MQEEVGRDKGQYKHLCTMIEVRSHGRSYYVKNMESRRIYLRNRKKLMLDKSECDTVAQTLLQETIMSDEINPCRRNGCLKSPNSKKIPKSVRFSKKIENQAKLLQEWREKMKNLTNDEKANIE